MGAVDSLAMKHLQKQFRAIVLGVGVVVVLIISASAQEQTFQIDPSQSSVKFTLGDVLHTVHGSFVMKHGELQLQPAGKLSGEIVVDATSGNSGSGMRDRKMNKEVLESARYPEIDFRPDRFDGDIARAGEIFGDGARHVQHSWDRSRDHGSGASGKGRQTTGLRTCTSRFHTPSGG